MVAVQLPIAGGGTAHFDFGGGDGSAGSPYTPSGLRFLRNGSVEIPTLAASAANNRPLPIVNLAGDGLGPLDVGAGAATSNTLRCAEANRTILFASGTFSTSGDNTAIAAPGAGLRIVITALRIQLEATTSTTVLIKNGASTTISRLFCTNQGDGISDIYQLGREIRLSTNTAFILNLSGANAVGYSVQYFTE